MAAHSGNKLSISLENIDHRLFSLIFRLDKSAFLEYFSNNAMRRASTLSNTESNHCSAADGFYSEIEGDAGIREVEDKVKNHLVLGRESINKKFSIRNDYVGHPSFGAKPHINVEVDGIKFHLDYVPKQAPNNLYNKSKSYNKNKSPKKEQK
ncbi:hypothetical protein KKF34_01750 [Myxococcota bacterium]|nr:hypothetical protein [Myxococcota bacterium]